MSKSEEIPNWRKIYKQLKLKARSISSDDKLTHLP